MLFDLRSRGRRRTVQVVYLGLAVLMGGGLVLFGVGTGTGGGGLLNAIGGNGAGGGQSQVASQQETNALKQIKQNPNDTAAWGSLLQARWTSAINGTNYSATTGFTTSGRNELGKAIQALFEPESTVDWQNISLVGFLGGFAERLVPSLLATFERRAESGTSVEPDDSPTSPGTRVPPVPAGGSTSG